MPTFELIATTASTSGTITFSAIPQTYTDLYIKGVARNSSAGSNTGFDYRINGSTTTSHYRQWRYEGYLGGTSAFTSYNGTQTAFVSRYITASGDSANDFTPIEIYFGKYSTATAKSMYYHAASWGFGNSRAFLEQYYNYFDNATAITSIDLISSGGTGFASGTQFWLYGIKNT